MLTGNPTHKPSDGSAPALYSSRTPSSGIIYSSTRPDRWPLPAMTHSIMKLSQKGRRTHICRWPTPMGVLRVNWIRRALLNMKPFSVRKPPPIHPYWPDERSLKNKRTALLILRRKQGSHVFKNTAQLYGILFYVSLVWRPSVLLKDYVRRSVELRLDSTWQGKLLVGYVMVVWHSSLASLVVTISHQIWW